MNPTATVHRLLLRLIAIIYLLIFLTALFTSAYFLKGIIALKPIPMIGLLKYLLLLVLFLILSKNACMALTLNAKHLHHLAVSTRNFKWLFAIAILISLLAWLGVFNTTLNKPVKVTTLQMVILIALAIFCFWSDSLLKPEKLLTEEPEEENTNT